MCCGSSFRFHLIKEPFIFQRKYVYIKIKNMLNTVEKEKFCHFCLPLLVLTIILTLVTYALTTQYSLMTTSAILNPNKHCTEYQFRLGHQC